MFSNPWVVAVIVVFVVACLGAGAVWLLRRMHTRRLAKARRDFQGQREHLEAKFFELAAGSGKPRGLDWVECDFASDVAFARDRRTGGLTALSAVTIRFAATKGGDMEDVEAVGNLRAATAVFQYEQSRWMTEGRAIFNLNPTEAIAYYGKNLEAVNP